MYFNLIINLEFLKKKKNYKVNLNILLQGAEGSIIFIVGLIIATIIVTLILYLAVKTIESPQRASDKKLMILLLAFLAVLILPAIVGALGQVLSAIGNILADVRTMIYPSGQNFLSQLIPVLYFLFFLVLVRWLVDIEWKNAVWISLLTLFITYVIYCIVPELYNITQIR